MQKNVLFVAMPIDIVCRHLNISASLIGQALVVLWKLGLLLRWLKQIDNYEGCLFIEHIVLDDDSSMKSHLRYIEDGGKLPQNALQPNFLADPIHIIKTICSPI